MRFSLACAALAATLLPLQALESQALPISATPTYADLADLSLTAPIAAHIRVHSVERLSQREAPSAPAGHRRFLVTADIVALIRGPGGLPARIRYLIDLPDDARGRSADIRRRSEWLILAARSTVRPDELRLAAPDAQIVHSPEAADRLRAILGEASAAAAPPPVTGIGRAFHVPGSLPGESETQIFLQTEGNRPISLSILRRPDQAPRWAVSLTEIVDDSAPSPARDSLLWYRLACGLPAVLPRSSLSDASADEARAIEADYGLVMRDLGSCSRSRRRP